MNILLTGAAGFLGSHVLWSGLRRDSDSRWLCVVRAGNAFAARERICQALRRAAWDCGEADVEAFVASCMLQRVTVCTADLTDPAAIERAARVVRDWAAANTAFETVHAAAVLSFNPLERDQAFAANLGGTQHLWKLVASQPGLQGFNLVSTAYVAGQRTGDILETLSSPPPVFNNPYEESKWHCEHWLVTAADDRGIQWRILRPSIIVGHSRTHRCSSDSGLYRMCKGLRDYKALLPANVTGLDVPVRTGARMDMMAVDIVCSELWDVIHGGEATFGRAFHLTQAHPLHLADLFEAVSPASGLSMRCLPENEMPPRDSPSGRFLRLFKPYLPYCSAVHDFSRANVLAIGAERHQSGCPLSLQKIRAMVDCYYGQGPYQEHPVLVSGV